ncbi:phenylacetate-CoA oxygenase subunit PaaC [Kocuria koreensis]|uniref:Phenylacetate-CoA oxygenase subunit PaaC n=1 Tax=Rothia koreensis TaxID=592378 RepID=A0A7K1LJT9_9MICC|nr:1,2-phenylacetyl-CoA epoxidase subunit PaaC [Rothia koreensis]MUN55467.1 phenylacetate-CoA oxygenase subunit PaaC [Rothia koreensis]
MSTFASQESATKISAGESISSESIAESGATASEDVAQYAMRLGDDALILSQRLGWWIARAPELEEDIALSNIALDLIGHARFLLTYAGTAWNKSEDDLAYFRPEEEFRSCRLVEQENGDFGQTIARQLIFSMYQYELYKALAESSDPTLAAIADKAVKEVEYHVDHASQWILRLGLGTEESRRRIAAGLEYMWPYVEELFTDDELIDRLDGVAVRPSSLEEAAMRGIRSVLAEAELEVPEVAQARLTSEVRDGSYSEHRGYILAEMQSLARQHPGATW